MARCMLVLLGLFLFPGCYVPHRPAAAGPAPVAACAPCNSQSAPTTLIYGYGPGWRMAQERRMWQLERQEAPRHRP